LFENIFLDNNEPMKDTGSKVHAYFRQPQKRDMIIAFVFAQKDANGNLFCLITTVTT
jgi:hypothetical protein